MSSEINGLGMAYTAAAFMRTHEVTWLRGQIWTVSYEQAVEAVHSDTDMQDKTQRLDAVARIVPLLQDVDRFPDLLGLHEDRVLDEDGHIARQKAREIENLGALNARRGIAAIG
jgi:hypothetical protein